MNLAKISIRNPAFIISVMLIIVVVGISSFRSMSVDLLPDATVPIISIVTVYQGVGASEIETLVSKPLEEQISSISGLKKLNSKSLEGVSQIIAEFTLGVDIRKVEQEIRDKVNQTRGKLPKEIDEPIIRRFDPSDNPTLTLSVTGDLNNSELYDVAEQVIKNRLEQINNVGAIEIFGGRKREIHVLLDRKKLEAKEISVSQVSSQIGASGENIPSGKVNLGSKELSFRGLGEFENVAQISDILVNLYGNEVPTKVGSLGRVVDNLEDEKNRTYVEGKPSLFLYVYRQSGTNTIEVADGISSAIKKLNTEFQKQKGNIQIKTLIDASIDIRNNVSDVYETIILAIILTVITVFFFLANFRTMFITALSLPIALVGAFIIMNLAGFSINTISLLGLSLSVGLLVDDAIVIIENIHRRIQLGEKSKHAAEEGTNELQLSVFSITLVVISVFVPVAFMGGIVGKFLMQFGLTIAFAMGISFFVSLTLIPMLAAYFVSHEDDEFKKMPLWYRPIGITLKAFDQFQTWLEHFYEKALKKILKYPYITLLAAFLVFALGIAILQKVPSVFKPEKDAGEVLVNLELPSGTSLDGTEKNARSILTVVQNRPEVEFTTLTIGGKNGEANKAEIFMRLKKAKIRKMNTSEFQDFLRKDLANFTEANPKVSSFDAVSSSRQPVVLDFIGFDQEKLEEYSLKVMDYMKNHPALKDVDTNYRSGKPEFRIKLRPDAANSYGINSKTMGVELRGQVEGFTPAKFRENGKEYNVRVRLEESQRNLKKNYKDVLVPNINHRLIRLSDIADTEELPGATEINRLNRSRYVEMECAPKSVEFIPL